MATEKKHLEFLKRMAVDFRAFKEYIEEMRSFRSFPWQKHDDQQDAKALVPPMAGILGASAVILNPKLKEAHVEIPHNDVVFKPTKSMLDILSERIDSDLNQRLTEFGKKNGFPVVFVFYQTLKDEDGVSKATCDIKMYKSDEKQDARLYLTYVVGNILKQGAGLLGIQMPDRM